MCKLRLWANREAVIAKLYLPYSEQPRALRSLVLTLRGGGAPRKALAIALVIIRHQMPNYRTLVTWFTWRIRIWPATTHDLGPSAPRHPCSPQPISHASPNRDGPCDLRAHARGGVPEAAVKCPCGAGCPCLRAQQFKLASPSQAVSLIGLWRAGERCRIHMPTFAKFGNLRVSSFIIFLGAS